MKTATVARRILFGLGALLLLSGLLIWIGSVRQVSAVHMLQGLVLVLLLWTVAAIAARAGVSLRIVALAVAWSLVALVIAVAQKELLTGSWHWTIQVLHIVTSIGVIAWGQRLVALTRRNGILASSSPRPQHPTAPLSMPGRPAVCIDSPAAGRPRSPR